LLYDHDHPRIQCKKSLKIHVPKGGNHNPYIEEEQTTQWPKENVTSGAGTAYPSGAPEFTPGF
jgi:hypothetical protein